MLIYIALSAIIIKQIYIFLYPIEYEIIVNDIKNKMNKLKEELEPQIMSLGYNLLYYYSVAQIYVNKIITFVSPRISVLWITLINFLKENRDSMNITLRNDMMFDHSFNLWCNLFIKNP